MQMKTAANVAEIEFWVENMREALVEQFRRGAAVRIGNAGGSETGFIRGAEWHATIPCAMSDINTAASEPIALAH